MNVTNVEVSLSLSLSLSVYISLFLSLSSFLSSILPNSVSVLLDRKEGRDFFTEVARWLWNSSDGILKGTRGRKSRGRTLGSMA